MHACVHGVVTCVCNPGAREAETGVPLELVGQKPRLLGKFQGRTIRDLILKGVQLKVVLWPLHACITAHA